MTVVNGIASAYLRDDYQNREASRASWPLCVVRRCRSGAVTGGVGYGIEGRS